MTSPTTSNLWSIHGNSATNVFAVGTGGVILRLTGSAWVQMTSPTSNTLYGVWVFSNTFAVAVGAAGTIVVWNGVSWSVVTSGTTNALFAVSGDAATGTIVAVGSAGTALTSSAASSSTWTASNPNFADDAMFGVWRNDAVGILAGFGSAGVLRRSTAGVWSLSTFAPTLNGAAASTPTSAFAAGNYGAFAQLTGGAWQSQFAIGGTYTYFSQLHLTPTGQLYGMRFAGAYLYSSGSWVTSYEPGTTGWTGIGGSASNDMFAGGNSGLLARYVTSWSVASPNPLTTVESVRRIGGAPGSPTFVVGGDTAGTGFILRFSSGAWTRMTLPTTSTIRDVSVVDASNAFAVGSNGTILRYNGTSWVTMTSGTTVTLRGVWAASANEVYAVGDSGTIRRWNGASWSGMPSGTTFALHAIRGLVGSYAIAVGEAMTVITGLPTTAATFALVGSARTPALGPRRFDAVTAATVATTMPDLPDRPAIRRENAAGVRPEPR